MTGKHAYLCVYDYGMGGVWIRICASSADEINKKYPDFRIVDDRPVWMTDDLYRGIVQDSTYDIDTPTGWLSNFSYSKQRESEGKWPFLFRGVKDGVMEYRTIWARDRSEIASRYLGLEDLTGVPIPVDELKDVGASDIDKSDEFLERYRK